MINRYTTTEDINDEYPDYEEEDCSNDYPLGGSVEPYDIQRDNELTQ